MFPRMFVVLLSLFYSATSNAAADEILNAGKLNFTNIATKYNLLSEEYDVTTEDGYILKLFNIPGNKRKPVLIMHGLADSADSLLLRGHNSIPYFLSKAGYDVWASNYRGIRYSRRHVTLNPDTDKEFWNFSMHEHGLYDLSASIDFVLYKTKVSRLSLIGYSEGSSLMFILGSLRPEYNDKINIFIAWTPTCYMDYMVIRNPLTISYAEIIRAILASSNEEILNDGSFAAAVVKNVCTWFAEICSFVLSIGSRNLDSLEPEYIRVVFGYYYPAGTSRKNLDYYIQTIISRRFAQYDYGPVQNLEKYNSQLPPVYDLRKANMTVALFTGENDFVSTKEDLNTLRKQLPNVVFYKIIKQTNHLGFTQSRYAPKDIFRSVFKLLKKYS